MPNVPLLEMAEMSFIFCLTRPTPATKPSVRICGPGDRILVQFGEGLSKFNPKHKNQ
jgi:hypothetical protein